MIQFIKDKTFRYYFIPFLGGIIGGVAVSNIFWMMLMPISLAILWSGYESKFSNFLWGFSFILGSHYWLLYLHPLTWLGFSWIESLLISLLILIVCSIFGGVLVTLWGFIARKLISKKFIFIKSGLYLIPRIIFLSLIWSFGELLLSQSSFFWIGVSESIIPGDLYLAGLAKWIGAEGVCSVQILIGFWIFLTFGKWKRKLNFKRIFFCGIFILIFLHFIGGLLILPNSRNALYPIAVWQTNIPNREKILLDNQEIQDQIILAQEKAFSNGAKFLLTPEGTVKDNFVLEKPSLINTLIGGFRSENNNLRSSLLAFKKGEQSPSGFVDKNRLVPLGEKIPKFLNLFSNGFSSNGGLEAGEKSRYFAWQNMPKFSIAICYEIADGLKIRNSIKNGSQIILTVANLDPYPKILFDQFLSLARMRSIENNRDTVIASNTGPSGLIKNDGRIEKLLKPSFEETKVLDANLFNKTTFYNKFGLTILLFTFIGMATIICF